MTKPGEQCTAPRIRGKSRFESIGAQMLEQFGAQRPLRAGSLIVTVFGELVDYDQVAVVVTVDGIPTAINESPGCSSGIGWQFLYDAGNTEVPSQIQLCQTTCQTIQGTAGVELNVEFPCGTLIY